MSFRWSVPLSKLCCWKCLSTAMEGKSILFMHIPKITWKRSFCVIFLSGKQIWGWKCPSAFSWKTVHLGVALTKKNNSKQKQLLTWQLNQQFIGSFFIFSIRETPPTLSGHQEKEGSQHKGCEVVFAIKMADWTGFLSPRFLNCFS